MLNGEQKQIADSSDSFIISLELTVKTLIKWQIRV